MAATASVKLSAKIPDASKLAGLAATLAERVAGVKVPELPLDEIAALTTRFRLEMPDPSRWRMAVPSSSAGILGALPDVTGAVGRIKGGLEAIEMATSINMDTELNSLRGRLESLTLRIEADPHGTIPTLFAPSAEVAGLLKESPLLNAVVALGKLLGFDGVARIPDTVLALGGFIQQLVQERIGRLVNAVALASAAASETEKLAARVGVVLDCAKRNELDRLLDRAVLAMDGGDAAARAALTTIRSGDPATIVAAERALAHAAVGVDDYVDGLARVFACVEAATIAVDLDATKVRFVRLAEELGRAEAQLVIDAASALSGLISSGKGKISGAGPTTLDEFRATVSKAIEDIRSAIDGFDLSKAEQAIDRVGDTIEKPLETLEQFKTDMEKLVGGAIDGIGEAISAVDIAPLRREFDATVGAIEAKVQALSGEITSVRADIESAVDSARTALAEAKAFVLDPNTGLKHQLDAVFGELNSLLVTIDIQGVVGGIDTAVSAVAQQLAKIDLTPTIDATVTAIDAVAAVIDAVAPLIVTDDLRTKLAEATEVLRQVDFGAIRDELQKILDEIIEGIDTDALGRIRAEYANVVAKVATLDPEPVLMQVQTEVFDPLLAELERLQPAESLKPLADGFAGAAAQLQSFRPTEHLQFLVDFHDEIKGKFEELDPARLLEPVDRALTQAREGLTDLLRIHAIHSALDEVSREVTGFVAKLDPSPLFAGIDQGVAELRSAIESFDPVVLAAPISRLVRDAYQRSGLLIDRAGLHVVMSAVAADSSSLQEKLAAVSQQLAVIKGDFTGIDLAAARTRLDTARAGVRAALAGAGLAGSDSERMTALVESLDAGTRLSAIESRQVRGQVALQGLGDGLIVIQAEAMPALVSAEQLIDAIRAFKSPVLALWNALLDPLRGFVAIPPNAGVRTILLAVFDAIDPRQWRVPLEALFKAVRDKVLGFIGDRVIGRIKSVLERIASLIGSLNIDALKAAIERARDRVRAQIDALDPAPLIASLQGMYDQIVAAFGAIDPRGLIDEIDTLYRNDVLGVIKAITPAELLVPPLKALFLEISGLLGTLDIDRILLPVIGELQRLRGSLLEGIERAGAAYEGLLDAIPTGPGGGVSVEATVEVG